MKPSIITPLSREKAHAYPHDFPRVPFLRREDKTMHRCDDVDRQSPMPETAVEGSWTQLRLGDVFSIFPMCDPRFARLSLLKLPRDLGMLASRIYRWGRPYMIQILVRHPTLESSGYNHKQNLG